jgi:hypothetical protein
MAVVTSAVIAAGATAYSAYSSSQANKAQAGAQQGLMGQAQGNAGAIFGSIPEPVQFNPMFQQDPGYGRLAMDTIKAGQSNVGDASTLTSAINRTISAQARQRVRGWDPTFAGALSKLQANRNQALSGYLPYEDAMGIVGNRGGMANDLGNAGGSSPQIAADLGMSRLDLMTGTGANLATTITNILDQVDPISRHASPQDYLLSPSQTVPWAIQENQFGAQFQAQQNAIAAMADPSAAGLFNMQSFNAGFAGQSQRNNAQMASAIASGVSGIAGAYGGGGGGYGRVAGAAGNYMASAPVGGATYQAPAAWSSGGYQPHSVSARPAGI